MNRMLARLVPCLCLVALTLANVGHADTLKLEGVSAQSGGEYIYPYQFSVNGSSTLTNLMCLDFNRTITMGEQWNVSVSSPGGSMTNSTQYEEEAYIYSQLGKGTYSNSTVQYAAWDIFADTSVRNSSGYNNQVSTLVMAAENAVATPGELGPGFYDQFVLYRPTSNQQGWTDGIPQEFIGTSPVPEPSSLVMFGSGLLGLAGVVRRKTVRG